MSDGYDFEAAEPTFSKYRVYLSSVPGHWERYDGHVDVFAPDDVADLSGEVFVRAVRTLARTSFPDRPSTSSWRMERFERL
jgi:hypothetical protein